MWSNVLYVLPHVLTHHALLYFLLFAFQQNLIPTYFDNPIGFSSFLRKLYRWGFKRVSCSWRTHEFGSSTFKRLHSNSAPSSFSGAAAVNTPSNDGESARMQVQQQPTQAFSSWLQQVMAQTNQQPTPNPLPTSQADANAIIALLPSIQHQLSIQQPSMPSQQSVLNQNIHHPDNADANYGMMLPQPALSNTITSSAMSQPNIMAVQTLLTLMHRVGKEDRERRAQVDAILHAIILGIAQIVDRNNMIEEAERQRGLVAALGGQTHGSTGETTTPNVPHSITVPSQQVCTPPPSAWNMNIQADSVARRRDESAEQLKEVALARNGRDNCDNEDINGDQVRRQLSTRKRKSLDDDKYDKDNYESWTKRLRPLKKSPRK
jgi:hypothetical protein